VLFNFSHSFDDDLIQVYPFQSRLTMVSKILLVIGVLVAGILIYAGFKTPLMKVERQISIKASPEKIFPFLNSSEKSNQWMPWKETDPAVQIKFMGPSEGVGSKAIWESTGQMGTGESEITESILNKSVKTKLNYTKPFSMSQNADFIVVPGANGETTVIWAVDGHSSYFFRLIGIFMNMDKIIGDNFNKGLNNLKVMAER
jgi:hypothetical protein